MKERKPKSKVAVVPVDKEVFRQVLQAKKSSIRKLGKENRISCSDKTIRRLLNERGGLRPDYVTEIAKFLDVDSRLLTGELFCPLSKKNDSSRSILYKYAFEHLNEFSYFREEQDRLRAEKMEETLKRILSLFDISYSQFQEKNFEDQYSFQQDLFTALQTVMYKHFEKDGYGNTDKYVFDRILYELESYRDRHYENQFAEEILRPAFLKTPPKGYSRKVIQKLSADELIDLDMSLQSENVSSNENNLKAKYKMNPSE